MQSLKLHSSQFVTSSYEELVEDLNCIINSKIKLDPSVVYSSQLTEETLDYADDFNYLSFTLVPVMDDVKLHIEFGLCGGVERLLSGGAVLSWVLKKHAVVDCEVLHIQGNAVSLAVFIEELKKHIGLPAVA